MDTLFSLHNMRIQDPENFQALDSKLKQVKYVHIPHLLQQLPIGVPGLYTLTGGCLTGKTTLLQLWMTKLLADGIPGEAIMFLSGKIIKDSDNLIHLLQTQFNNKSCHTPYILIDDVTYLHGWDKAIKFVIDKGLLDEAIIMLTSSDHSISKKLHDHFPHRQNETKKVDFRLYPLTFREFVTLKYPHAHVTEIDLFKEFNEYLLHGGYLVAINDIASHGKILPETLETYADSLRKEVLKHGKQEHFFREMMTGIVEHYYQPITWNMLSQELSIEHPKTIGDYIALLESLYAVFVQPALIEEKLQAAPKKARRLMFTDPFIFHAIRAWLHPSNKNIFETEIKSSLDNPDLCSRLVKACATIHYGHYYPTYYIKAEGEVDLAYLYESRFWPIIITWTNPLRTKDLKRILKYPNGKILTKALRSGIIEHIRTEPLPQALWKLEEKK